eukprot:scaffold311002_cov27-Prasinocladus_malaysianus.AAC.1
MHTWSESLSLSYRPAAAAGEATCQWHWLVSDYASYLMRWQLRGLSVFRVCNKALSGEVPGLLLGY